MKKLFTRLWAVIMLLLLISLNAAAAGTTTHPISAQEDFSCSQTNITNANWVTYTNSTYSAKTGSCDNGSFPNLSASTRTVVFYVSGCSSFTITSEGNSTPRTLSYQINTGTIITTAGFGAGCSSQTFSTGNLGSITISISGVSASVYLGTVRFFPCTAPTLYNVSGSTTICSGNSTNVILDGSQNGVTYQLLKDGIAMGSTVTGTGSPLSWLVSSSGTYTITSTIDGGTYCATLMNSNAIINVTALPTTAVAGTNINLISPTFTTSLAANTPTIGTGTWSIVSGPSSNISQLSNLNSSTAIFTADGGIGTYTLCWTIANGICSSSSNVNVIIASGTEPALILTSGSINQTVSANTSISNIIYTWAGTANTANVIWTGSSSSTPANISETKDGGTKTLTLSGVPSVAGTYNYSIESTDGSNNYSSPLTGSIIVKLATPTVQAASSQTNNGFTANWNMVTNASSYILNVYQGAGLITSITGIDANATSQIVTGLNSNTSYTFTVTAIGNGSLIPNSNESAVSASVRTLNSSKAITVFSIPTQISSTINEGAKTILIYVPVGTDMTSLSPTVTTSPYATVSPLSGSAKDFTSAVSYTVTAEDLSTQVYTVTVAIGTSPTDYFKSVATGNWGNNTIWQSSASPSGPWMAATTAPTNASLGVSVQDGYTVTVNTATTISSTIVDAISTLKATGTVTLGGSMTVNGKYEHAMDGGVIPNATWNNGSTCLVDGVTANIPTGTDQNFCNFTWNCPSQTASHTSNLWSDGRHITGNVILTTGTGNLRILSMAAGITRSVTIDGNFTITKGTGTSTTIYTNGSSGAGTSQLNIGGDFITSSGSSFYFNNGAGHSACILNISGNFSNGGTLTSLLSTDVVTINFVKAGIQTYANSGTFSSLTAMTTNVNSGSTVSLTNNLPTTTLNIKSGAKLTNNATLTATTFNILSDATGTGTYLDNGTSNITTATVQQYLTTGRNWYIASPVTAAPRSAITNATNVNSYVEGSETWSLESASNTLMPLKGYVATVDGASGAVTFSGTLNNGPVSNTSLGATSTGIYTGYNLAGNPYPSYVNWNAATKTNLSNTMWYRTLESGAYKFYTYLTVDASGIGVPASVTNYIPPMQAFWVQVTSGTGTLGFDNTMRSHQDVAGNALKAPAAKSSAQQLVRLQVSNGTNEDEAVVYITPNASNGFDKYDSPKMSNNDPAIPEIYTTVGSEKLVINGMNSITTNAEIPLGFTTGQSNSFSIKASEITNFDSNTRVYLKDKLLGTQQDLTDGSAYTFASDIASTTDRFSVVFKTVGVTTGTEAAAGDPTALIYKNANNQIAVNCIGDINSDAMIYVYNALGQKLESLKITGTVTVTGKALTSGVYVVTVMNGGKSTTKKVILN